MFLGSIFITQEECSGNVPLTLIFSSKLWEPKSNVPRTFPEPKFVCWECICCIA